MNNGNDVLIGVAENNSTRKIDKKVMSKIARIGLDKETIKKRKAFISEARIIYSDKSKENILYVRDNK